MIQNSSRPGADPGRTADGGQASPGPWALLAATGSVLRSTPGMVVTTVEYLRHRPEVRHELVDLPGQPDGPDPARDLPGDEATLLRRDHGHGRTYRRVYRVRVAGSELTAEQLVAQLLQDPNEAAPTEVSVFEPKPGHGRRPGDEMEVVMPGPWDAPVRIVERDATSFRFATLRGHMEAGEIEFRAVREGSHLVFTIESWSRSGDRLFDVLYDKIPLAREMQLHMWVQMCQGVVSLCEGSQVGPVTVRTERWAAPW